MQLFGGVEAGGTKFICAIGNSEGKIFKKIRIPTTMPDETMGAVVKFFQDNFAELPISAVGIGTFGPLYLNPKSPYFGYVHANHKTGWGNVNMLGIVKDALRLPVVYDTDVNTAAIGEWKWGAGLGFNTFAYWTVGTGIGAGCIADGKIMHGMIHPEMGHAFVPQDKTKDPFVGVCSYHKNCLEGLASGPSLQKRWGVKSAMDLPPDHPAWDLEAEYLGYAMANCILNVSPERIILGGGVMQQQSLYAKIRAKTKEFLNGFIKHDSIIKDIDHYIVPPSLSGDAGVLGAIAIASFIVDTAT